MSDTTPAEADDEQLAGEERDDLHRELERRRAEADMEVPIVAAISAGGGPVQPVRLRNGDALRFQCHARVSCWNECCHNTDITLTPYDLIRLGRNLGIRPGEVALRYGEAAIHGPSGMPVLHLGMAEAGESRRPCVFLDPARGCTVYEDRPAACRYYPLGLATVKMKGHDAPEDFYFLVKEPHCRGHEEAREIRVGEYRDEQGVAEYDESNRGWIHILMKLASWKTLGGPWGKEPDARVRQMFLLATTDIDAFRRFVFESSFLQRYAVDPQAQALLREDDEALLRLAFDWLRSVLFNEPTLQLRPAVLQEAIARARTETGAT